MRLPMLPILALSLLLSACRQEPPPVAGQAAEPVAVAPTPAADPAPPAAPPGVIETTAEQPRLLAPTVDGGLFDLAAHRGRWVVVNFWATWCPPCIAELPLLDGFYRENASKNWKVLGIAVDQLASVKGFLERSPVTFPVAMAGQGGIELARSLGNLHGGLPFSVLFGADGRILHRKMGQVTDGDLRAWLRLG